MTGPIMTTKNKRTNPIKDQLARGNATPSQKISNALSQVADKLVLFGFGGLIFAIGYGFLESKDVLVQARWPIVVFAAAFFAFIVGACLLLIALVIRGYSDLNVARKTKPAPSAIRATEQEPLSEPSAGVRLQG